VLIARWFAGIDRLSIQQIDRGISALARDYPEGVALVAFSGPTRQGMHDDAIRGELAALLELHAKALACVAWITHGTGFHVGATRSMIAAAGMEARQPCPIGFHTDLENAAEWIAARLRGSSTLHDPYELVEVLEQFERERARSVSIPVATS
jgi:hypothetical protein